MEIKLQIGNKNISVNGDYKEMDVSPFTQNDRTFVPVRFVSESLGYKVEWNEKDETVTISDKIEFDTIEDCVLYWANTYNNASIGIHAEFGSSIYFNGNKYYYTIPSINYDKFNPTKNVPSVDNARPLSDRIAIIHSHSSIGYNEKNGMCTNVGNNFSTSDTSYSQTYKCDNYVATPCGRLLKYDYKTNKTTTISETIPYDRRAENLIYKNNWNKKVSSILSIYKEWYKENKQDLPVANFFNHLFINNIPFPKIQNDSIDWGKIK